MNGLGSYPRGMGRLVAYAVLLLVVLAWLASAGASSGGN